jgi:hypothetical protein
VRVWLDLRRAWDSLDPSQRSRVAALLPAAAALAGDGGWTIV